MLPVGKPVPKGSSGLVSVPVSTRLVTIPITTAVLALAWPVSALVVSLGVLVVLLIVLLTGSVTPPNCAWPVPGHATRLANAPATPMTFLKSNVFMMHALP
jgi:hypothetical protein